MRRTLFAYLVTLLILTSAQSQAQWIEGGVCVGGGSGIASTETSDGWTIVSDLRGGVFTFWMEQRAGRTGVYVQHTTGKGETLLGSTGAAVCTPGNGQSGFKGLPDGVGGCYIAWLDYRSGVPVVYVQRVDSLGRSNWTPDGIVASEGGTGESLSLVSDGEGGIIVAWGGFGARAQRFSPEGERMWALGGVWVSEMNAISQMSMSSTPSGEPLFAWFQRVPNYNGWVMHAQSIDETGQRKWPGAGVQVLWSNGADVDPKTASLLDGNGLVMWRHNQVDGTAAFMAQCLDSLGQLVWDPSGIVVASDASDASLVAIDSSSAVAVWAQGASPSGDIYAQRLSPESGPEWGLLGKLVCNSILTQDMPRVISDGRGGCFVAWSDDRQFVNEGFLQRLDGDGAPIWPTNGRTVLNLPHKGAGFEPVLTADGDVIVGWNTGGVVYATKVLSSGGLGLTENLICPIVSIGDVEADEGGWVALTVAAAPGDLAALPPMVSGYSVWRLMPDTPGQYGLDVGGSAHCAMELTDVPQYVRATQGQALGFPPGSWESVGMHPATQGAGYRLLAPTRADSTSEGPADETFVVVTHTTRPDVLLVGTPHTSQSVDNLVPPAPTPFVARYSTQGTALHWLQSRARDVAFYRLYRGTSAGFTPVADNLVTAQADTGYFDTVGASQFYYKLAAVDVHGNVGRYAIVSPDGSTAAFATFLSAEVLEETVRLRWYLSTDEPAAITVYRRMVDGGWQPLGTVAPDGAGYVRFEDSGITSGARYGYRLGIQPAGGPEAFAGESWVDIPLTAIDLAVRVPNPIVGGDVAVSFAAPAGRSVRVELFDMAGRSIASRTVAGGTGRRSLSLARSSDLAPGVYLVRVGLDEPVVVHCVVLR